MKRVASLFSADARDELKKQLGIELSGKHDYTKEELEALYERITDDFPYSFDTEGNPSQTAIAFESIIDVFIQNKLIHTA